MKIISLKAMNYQHVGFY